MMALSHWWPQASALAEHRAWNNLSLHNENEMQKPSTSSLQPKSWPINWDGGEGAVKQESNISLCLLDNFVRGNVTMAMGGL